LDLWPLVEKEQDGTERIDLLLPAVLMLETAALQQLGKLINPLTGKVEQDLGQAKFSIDMLGMIEEKTKGNLTVEEHRYLQGVLSQLHLNYVEKANKPKPAPTSQSGPSTEINSQ
jgi:hypothetical protein